jgi:hypothetical protein
VPYFITVNVSNTIDVLFNRVFDFYKAHESFLLWQFNQVKWRCSVKIPRFPNCFHHGKSLRNYVFLDRVLLEKIHAGTKYLYISLFYIESLYSGKARCVESRGRVPFQYRSRRPYVTLKVCVLAMENILGFLPVQNASQTRVSEIEQKLKTV